MPAAMKGDRRDPSLEKASGAAIGVGFPDWIEEFEEN
jgi:hypothetical protein